MKLLIQGRPGPPTANPELARGLPAESVKRRVSATVRAADRAGTEPIQVEVQGDDIVELEMQDGVHVWVRVDDLEKDFGLSVSRQAGEEAILLPTTLHSSGGPSRGKTAWAIKALSIFGVDVAGEIDRFVSDRVERQLTGG